MLREYLEPGDNRKVFSADISSLSEEYSFQIRIFGKILATYTLSYQEILWPYGLDISRFMIPYKRSLGIPWAPRGSTIAGAVGKALSYLEELGQQGGSAFTMADIPKYMKDILIKESRPVQQAILAKL